MFSTQVLHFVHTMDSIFTKYHGQCLITLLQPTLKVTHSVYNARTKRVNVRYHFVRDVIDKGDTSLVKVHTHENPVDMRYLVVSSSIA